MSRTEDVCGLIRDGLSYQEISTKLGITKATISYHAKKGGLSNGRRKSYDWEEINSAISNGMTYNEVSSVYGCNKATISKAVSRGDITKKHINFTAEEYSQKYTGVRARSHHRKYLKRKLLDEGMDYLCSECGISNWHGKFICLELDHIDGNPRNNELSNFRLLCPNCHSQTDTWRGRNAWK